MRNSIVSYKNVFVLFIVAAITFSCSTDEDKMDDNLNNTVLTADELQLVLETDQLSGVVDTLLSELYMNNGATGKSAETGECYTTEYSDTGYTVTFDDCTLNETDTVSGTLSVAYGSNGENTSFAATYSDFFVNGAELNGTRSFLLVGEANGNSLSFSVTSDMDMVWADGTIVAESGNRAFGFSIGDSLEDIAVTLNGNWNLAVGADVYKVTITDTLETNIACSYISEGKMTLDKNGLVVLVDFGNGTCDDGVTITYPNGTTEEISLKD